MAAAAYEAAAAAGGAEAVAAAAMSRGELLLAHARRCARQGAGGDAASGREALSQAAGSFEELAARAADSESAATALYNLACARSMLGDADAAAAALGRCFKKLPKAGRARWANEMLEDDDLRWAREGSPELSAALTRAAGR
ncbi:unnamed protein product [Prorocentrum cordatum]|uniref:KIF-binding protein n=1 Tax=Prorocentrum cordatum TaxID=2364126 RepID=A0ABN9PZY4_9DINO|nr:unnamed protein product [Polarella glacialis]